MVSYDESLFTLQHVPERGIAAFASRKIASGTQLHSEKALIMIMDYRQEGYSTVSPQLELLSITQKQEFFSLRNSYPNVQQVEGIVRTNAMPVGKDRKRFGVFPICSRFNHACTPNAEWQWNNHTQEEFICAIRDIEAKEEITVNYISEQVWMLPGQKRREIILEEYGFSCSCVRCVTGQANGEGPSDERRKRLGEIVEKFRPDRDDLIRTNPAKALPMCQEAIALYEAEGEAGPCLEYMYRVAWQICISRGDVPCAARFAFLATECSRLVKAKTRRTWSNMGSWFGGLRRICLLFKPNNGTRAGP